MVQPDLDETEKNSNVRHCNWPEELEAKKLTTLTAPRFSIEPSWIAAKSTARLDQKKLRHQGVGVFFCEVLLLTTTSWRARRDLSCPSPCDHPLRDDQPFPSAARRTWCADQESEHCESPSSPEHEPTAQPDGLCPCCCGKQRCHPSDEKHGPRR